MYELIKINESDYYINAPVKIGVIKVSDTEAVIIDSGNDKDAGKRIKKILDAEGLSIKAIYNTHSHADHIGGNRYLETNSGCEIYAPGMEAAFTRQTILEPTLLYGGNPPEELRHKFLMAEKSSAKLLTEASLPDFVKIIPLRGHTPDMVGFLTSGGTAYIGDCLSGEATLQKYQIGYVFDVGSYLETLKNVMGLKANLFVPSHTEATDNIIPLAELNIKKIYEVGDRLTKLLKEPKSFETLLQKVFESYGLKMTFEQNALIGSTVRSYLTWLKEQGRVTAFIENNHIMWNSL